MAGVDVLMALGVSNCQILQMMQGRKRLGRGDGRNIRRVLSPIATSMHIQLLCFFFQAPILLEIVSSSCAPL